MEHFITPHTTLHYHTDTECCKDGKSVNLHLIAAGIKCGNLETPAHGSKQGGGDAVGSVVAFTCDTGYHLEGSTQRECSPAGTWDGVEARCIGKSTESSLTCRCLTDNVFLA